MNSAHNSSVSQTPPANRKRIPRSWITAGLLVIFLDILCVGTFRNPHFWLTADQRGDFLMRKEEFGAAAKAYADPWRIGVAQYRNGDFESAARTFARVPGANGAFNQGNAWLMHGKYAAAIQSYGRALGFRPGWKEAEDNKALALARQKLLDDSGKNAEQESADAYKPDEIVFDQKGENKAGKPIELTEQKMSDEQLRATWLRRVQTTPADFLRAKFAYQAQSSEKAAPAKEEAK